MRKIPYVEPDPQSWLEKFHFSLPIKVRFCETDMLGHLNNVSYFIYFEQGRVDYLEHVGAMGGLFGEGIAAVAADLECQFLEQVYREEPLKLYVRAGKMGRSSIDIEYALAGAESAALKAVGRGAMVHIDTTSGKSLPLPNEVRAKIAAFEGME